MTDVRKSILSTIFVGPRWRANVDLVAQPVAVALVPVTRPLADTDWKTAGWETPAAVVTTNLDTQEVQYRRWARILVGPAAGVINPARGRYGVYARLTDSPEIAVLAPDQLGYLDVL